MIGQVSLVSTDSNSPDAVSATSRLIAKLQDPNAMFTRDQVAWLMATTQRWAQEAAADAVNDAYPPEPIWDANTESKAHDQIAYRRECDAAARLPRLNDFRPMEAAA